MAISPLFCAARSLLLIVDLQDRLVPALDARDRLVDRVGVLVQAAALLQVPIVVTEHMPEKIGHTVPSIRSVLPATAQILRKTAFSGSRDSVAGPALATAVCGRDVVVCGAEAHVCVLQTALSLEGAASCALVADAVSSREAADRDAALTRARDTGLGVVTSEMVAFEWLERGDTPAFRHVIPSIRARRAVDPVGTASHQPASIR